MRPITAKGGITGTDLPRVRGKVMSKYMEYMVKSINMLATRVYVYD